jgi:hypothetical protein
VSVGVVCAGVAWPGSDRQTRAVPTCDLTGHRLGREDEGRGDRDPTKVHPGEDLVSVGMSSAAQSATCGQERWSSLEQVLIGG